jgi:hypothetical protein
MWGQCFISIAQQGKADTAREEESQFKREDEVSGLQLND